MVAFGLVAIGLLKPHEQTQQKRLHRLIAIMRKQGAVYKPIIVDKHSLVILDGHHRCKALKQLGAELVPAYLVDYGSRAVKVKPRRKIQVSKRDVLATGLGSKPYPPKTTRHTLNFKLPRIRVPISLLKTKNIYKVPTS